MSSLVGLKSNEVRRICFAKWFLSQDSHTHSQRFSWYKMRLSWYEDLTMLFAVWFWNFGRVEFSIKWIMIVINRPTSPRYRVFKGPLLSLKRLCFTFLNWYVKTMIVNCFYFNDLQGSRIFQIGQDKTINSTDFKHSNMRGASVAESNIMEKVFLCRVARCPVFDQLSSILTLCSV